jgi:hypothetical protein
MQKNKGIVHIFLIALGVVIVLLLIGFFNSQQNIDSTIGVLKVNE